MKVYIASKYIVHREINCELAEILEQYSFEPFLPATINIDAITKEEMYEVAEICYREIQNADVVLVVAPFGISVSAEIGFAIANRKLVGKPRYIIGFRTPKEDEAMVIPYFDYIVENTSELISVLNKIKS